MLLVERAVTHLSPNTINHIAPFQVKQSEMQNVIIIIVC
jgi:hypothetical protein